LRLERLQAAGFRNLAPLDLELGAPFVVWYGPNGMGKTNALEAVHWLAALKPLRGARVRDLVSWEQVAGGPAVDPSHVCTVAGRARAEGVSRSYQVELGPVRKIALDGRPVADLADYFAGLRCIAFQPSDAEIVSGEPARRRAWLDRAAFTASPSHLAVVRTLRRVVDQKAALLRNPRLDLTLLDALDDQLVSTGSALI
jgi:DNA replication and repair protein RecF